MLTAQSYLLAWAVYLAAALGLLWLVRHWLAARVGAGLQVTLLLVLAALVLTPSLAHPDLQSYAPAAVVAIFDLLTQGSDSVLRSLEPMLLMLLLALGLGVLFVLLKRWVIRKN